MKKLEYCCFLLMCVSIGAWMLDPLLTAWGQETITGTVIETGGISDDGSQLMIFEVPTEECRATRCLEGIRINSALGIEPGDKVIVRKIPGPEYGSSDWELIQ